MAYDLSKAMAQAIQVTESSESNDNNQYKLIYPQEGTIKVRLLYNDKSGLIIRKIIRHKIGGKQVVCLTNYSDDCPVCKVLNDIENVRGSVPWQLKRTTRGIAYAEYVDSDYKWSNPNNIPNKGDIVLLMFPWSVYVDLSRLFNSAGDKLGSLVTSNVGGVFKISRWMDRGQVRYRTEIDPFDNQHQTCRTDEEYFDLINNLPSLNEQFVPIKPTNEIVNAARDTANQLTTEYLGNSVIQPAPQQSVVPHSTNNLGSYGGTIQNNHTTQAPTPKPQNGMQKGSPNAPACFGKHNDPSIDPNQCLMCPYEVQCMSNSN